MIKTHNYSPLFFLAALGAGGLSVTFFMYLMFLVPHQGFPIPNFTHISEAITQNNWLSYLTIFALTGILLFAFYFIKLLIWNTKQFLAFKKNDNYKKLKESNAEVTLMAIPLTSAMGVNVAFILGALFVPNLWNVVEYLFPFALIAFAIIGYFALNIFVNFFARILNKGNFNFDQNNSFAQMISIFAFAMIGVGFAAPGAMSHTIQTNAIGIFGAIFFMSFSIVLLFIKLTLGFKSMFKHGLNKEASPTLWILIPILTLIGITLVRINFGLDHNFNTPLNPSKLFILTSTILSLQIIFGIMGYKVMKQNNYFQDFIENKESKSPATFALICPGVAIVVFGWFFINFGLVKNNLLDASPSFYIIFLAPFIYIQIKTIQYFFKLKNKFQL